MYSVFIYIGVQKGMDEIPDDRCTQLRGVATSKKPSSSGRRQGSAVESSVYSWDVGYPSCLDGGLPYSASCRGVKKWCCCLSL
jgi:hypothetical protein